MSLSFCICCNYFDFHIEEALVNFYKERNHSDQNENLSKEYKSCMTNSLKDEAEMHSNKDPIKIKLNTRREKHIEINIIYLLYIFKFRKMEETFPYWVWVLHIEFCDINLNKKFAYEFA